MSDRGDDLTDHVKLELRLQRLEIWKNGNGSLGAEARLQAVEKCSDALTKLELPEKFSQTRHVAFQARDDLVAVKERISELEERSVTSDQLEIFMSRVISKIDAKIGEKAEPKPKTRPEMVLAFAPIVASTLSFLGLVVLVIVSLKTKQPLPAIPGVTQ